jgi:hypothetical protein
MSEQVEDICIYRLSFTARADLIVATDGATDMPGQ